MHRTWLRGRENAHKRDLTHRYLIYVAECNLELIMRLLAGTKTPEGLARVSI